MYRNTFSNLLPGSWSQRRQNRRNKRSEASITKIFTPILPSKIVVAGVNGKLGPHVIRHLLAFNFAVTALTTDPVKVAETYPGIQTIRADYINIAGLLPSLRGFDALVILISRSQDAVQIPLIDVAIEAGIPHIIPSSFGIDTRIQAVRDNPGNISKIAAEDHLQSRANEGIVTFTIIQTGIFLEWSFVIGTPINLSGITPTLLFDGGHVSFSISSLNDIGRAVATALTLRNNESVRNKVLLMHSAVSTQNQLLQFARELRPTKEWQTVNIDTEVAYMAAMEAYGRGELDNMALRGFFPRLTYGLGLGLLDPNDNEVLGIRIWREEELKRAVEKEILRREAV